MDWEIHQMDVNKAFLMDADRDLHGSTKGVHIHGEETPYVQIQENFV